MESLQARAFVGTQSRLHTVVELLRQIVHGSETDPDVRLGELRRQVDAIDREMAAVEAGEVVVMDEAGVRDRYQQFAATARELLSDRVSACGRSRSWSGSGSVPASGCRRR